MTELQIRSAINGYEDLRKLVETVARNIANIRNVHGSYISFYVEGETVCANFEESHCGCCSPDYNEIEFPISYLWTENYDTTERDRQAVLAEAARLQKLIDEAEERRKREEATEARDRANYERLKAKYES